MNGKLMAFFVFCFSCLTLFSMVAEGNGGYATSYLTDDIDETATTISVNDASGFLNTDWYYIENEVVYCSGKSGNDLTGCTRGQNGTDAKEHLSTVRIYNEATGVVNQVIGYNFAATTTNAGRLKAAALLPAALTSAVPKLIMWDYSFLTGNMEYLKYMFLYPLSAGFVISLLQLFASLFQAVFKFW